MKKEAGKKSKKWLWLVLGLVALAAVVGVVLALVLGGQGQTPGGATGGRPDLYWNVDKAYYTENSESGLSNREPGTDGMYHVRFAYNGEIVELPVADKRLINTIDFMDAMGLVLDADGIIVDIKEPRDIATVVGEDLYVQRVEGNTIIANTSMAMNGMQIQVSMTTLTELYDVSTSAEVVGEVAGIDRVQPMDCISVYANDLNENTHIYLVSHPVESKVYWRAEQFYDSTLKTSTRECDENGVYSIDFFCDGERVTLKCKDKALVDEIDNDNVYQCHFGFEFDEEGYIVKLVASNLGIRALIGCQRCDVIELDGNTFSATRLVLNPDGVIFTATIPEDCVIYDVSTAALAEGRQGQRIDSLQMGDRVCVFTDAQGTPVLIYVACRTVESDAYFNVTRKYDSTLKSTTRTPNWEGYYEIELLRAGDTESKIYRTKDKALVDYLDSFTIRTVGLAVDGDIITRVYHSECVFGVSHATAGTFVTTVAGISFQRTIYGQPGRVSSSIMASDCKVYNVSEVGTYGAETTLQEGDRIYAHKQPTGELVCVFVTQRNMGLDTLYWNLEPQYDSKTKTTTREPDENGWYVFEMAHNGKQITVKTRSKSLASQVDAQAYGMCLVVENGIITDVAGANNSTGGLKVASGYRIKSISEDGTVVAYYQSGSTYKERSFKLADDCVIYNVSAAYYDFKGETTSYLQVGDMITCYTNVAGQGQAIYVRNREVDYMYWKVDRYYDSATASTTRKPDGNGWYYFDLAVNGKVKTFKTNNVDIASQMDYYSSAFGLRVDGDVIRSVVPTAWVKGVGYNNYVSWDVMAINGNKVTVKYNRPGSDNTGKTETFTLTSDVDIYDVSPTAKSFGAEVKLQVGDTIRTYWDDTGSYQRYIYVLYHNTREAGLESYCEHCGKVVYWNAYSGGSITRAAGHYYLNASVETGAQLGVGLENSDYEIVLDLNGKTLTRTEGGRFALVRYGDTLTIMDSVGGGAIKSYGADKYNGGVIYALGGKLNLLGGTLELLESDCQNKWGGVVYLGEETTFKMYGGTIIGNSAERGGGVYNTGGSTMELHDGTITGGISAGNGGNVYVVSGSTFKMYGGTVSDGYAEGRAGNVFVDSGTLELLGGTITGGSSGKSDDGVCIGSTKAYVTVGDLNCEDKFLIRYLGGFTLTGAPKIANMEVASGYLVTLGEIKAGTEVYVTANGQFAEPNEDSQTYLDAGYFKSANESAEVYVLDNALYAGVAPVEGYCEHCGQTVIWTTWSAKENITGPSEDGAAIHYYLEGDYSEQTAQRTIRGNVVLDLHGKTYTTDGIRNFLVYGDFSILDNVGGGEMISTGVSTTDGSIAYIASSEGVAGTVNVYSGKLTFAEGGTIRNGGLFTLNKGNLNIYGGELVSSGTVKGKGGAIHINGYGNLTIAGGSISGGNINTVGTAENNTALNITGGSVSDELLVGANVNVSLSGAPVLSKLALADGILLKLGELTEGAEIYVSARGTFTEALTDAESYLAYIKSADPSTPVTVVDNALSIGNVVSTEQTAYCEHCDREVQWTPWSASDNITGPDTGADHYYLDGDYKTQTAQRNIRGNVVLDLNGKTYSTDGIRNFIVYGDFHIQDSQGGGVMIATGKQANNTDGSIAYINGGGSVTLHSGTLELAKEHNTFRNGGIIAVNKGSLNICGGTVIGGEVSGKGGVFHVSSYGTIAISGGTISGGSLNIVGVQDNATTLNISGGNVSGDVLIGENVNVTLSGAPVLANLDLSGGKTVSLGEMMNGAAINVTAEGVFTVENDKAADYASFFTSNVADTEIAVVDKALAVVSTAQPTIPETTEPSVPETTEPSVPETTEPTVPETTEPEQPDPVCEHCNKKFSELTWQVWDASENITGPDTDAAHYYLDSDYTAQTAQRTIRGNVVLDLRGKTYSTEGIRNFLVYGNFSIMDSVGGGEMITTGKSTTDGAIAYIATSGDDVGTLNLYSGTLTFAEGGAIRNGGIFAINKANLNIYGGEIVSSGTVSGKGGIVYVNNYANITVAGGTVSGGSVYTVGKADNVSSLVISGGNVSSDVLVGENVDVTLSGAPVLANLDLSGGRTVTLGALESGASIAVTAEGVFTVANDKAADYAACFKSAVADTEISVVDNTLAVTAQGGTSEPTIPETTEPSVPETTEPTVPETTEPTVPETTEPTVPETTEPEYPKNTVYATAVKMTEEGVFAGGGTVTAVCPYCEAEAAWEPLEAISATKTINQSGHYYLAEDLTNSGYYKITGTATVCLHLNGHNITSSVRALYADTNKTDGVSTLNIMGNGIVTGAGSSLTQGGALDIAGAANLCGGTYRSTVEYPVVVGRGSLATSVINVYEGAVIERTADGIAGCNVHIRSNSKFYMYGGTVTGGTVTADALGGNIYLLSTAGGNKPTVGIYGGTVSDGTIFADGLVDKKRYAYIELDGGTVSGKLHFTDGCVFTTLSGAPVVSDLDLSNGATVALGTLEAGADITVNANGTFTDANENAQSYLVAGYFKAPEGKAISVADNALVMSEATVLRMLMRMFNLLCTTLI